MGLVILLSAASPGRGIPLDEMTWVNWVVWVGGLLGIIAFIVWKRSRGE